MNVGLGATAILIALFFFLPSHQSLAITANGAEVYLITDLGTLGGADSWAYGINNSGQIVGASEIASSSGSQHPFLYSRGKLEDMGLPAAATSGVALAINSSGEVAGTYTTTLSGYVTAQAFIRTISGWTSILPPTGSGKTSGAWNLNSAGQVVGFLGTSLDAHAFLYDGSDSIDLGTLANGSYSEAVAINDSGQAVGFSTREADCCISTYIYTDGRMTDLGLPQGADSTMPFGLNQSGQIAGIIGYGSVLHAALFDRSSWQDLGVPIGFASSIAQGINNFGEVVGTLQCDGNSCNRAFMYKDGALSDLNGLLPSGTGWVMEDASGVNDSGWIVGWGTIGGYEHAFLFRQAVVEDCRQSRWWRMGPPGEPRFQSEADCLQFFGAAN